MQTKNVWFITVGPGKEPSQKVLPSLGYQCLEQCACYTQTQTYMHIHLRNKRLHTTMLKEFTGLTEVNTFPIQPFLKNSTDDGRSSHKAVFHRAVRENKSAGCCSSSSSHPICSSVLGKNTHKKKNTYKEKPQRRRISAIVITAALHPSGLGFCGCAGCCHALYQLLPAGAECLWTQAEDILQWVLKLGLKKGKKEEPKFHERTDWTTPPGITSSTCKVMDLACFSVEHSGPTSALLNTLQYYAIHLSTADTFERDPVVQ